MNISKSEVMAIKADGVDRILHWFSWHFNGAIFLDAGTLKSNSARILGVNPTNLVLTYDIASDRIPGITDKIKRHPNILFKHSDVNALDPGIFKKIDLVYLDISHNGEDEKEFLKKLDVCFTGILIMDDIDHPRYPELKKVFEGISKPKFTLDDDLRAFRGTGIVPYGEKVRII